jgi:5-methylcytosine-specific restriction enzyme A
MPTAPKRPCPVPGCRHLTDAGRCPEHGAARRRLHDQARTYDHAERYGARHRRWRAMVLARDPLCRGHPEGIHGDAPPPSVVADHKLALEDGGDWSLENGQGLCVQCHNRKSREEQRQRGTRRGGASDL